MSKLKEGLNEIECTAREVTTNSTASYTLTADEAAEVKKLKARIDEIITAAKARYVAKPKMLTIEQVNAMSDEAREKYISSLEAYVSMFKA